MAHPAPCPRCSVLLIALCCAAQALAQDNKPPTPDAPAPLTPGVHWLSFDHTFKDQTTTRKYGLYLPTNIADAAKTNKKLALLVCLSGRGGLGESLDRVYIESAIGMLRQDKLLGQSVDFLILRPVSATYGGWDDEQTAAYIVAAIGRVAEHYPVDKDRIHLIGMSLGGQGVWHVAKAGPGLFASIAAISGRGHPDPDAVAKAVQGSAVLITVGANDGDFTTGSDAMAQAMRRAGVDVHHVVVPGGDHGAYYNFYYRSEVYQWMLKHRRSAPPPADRADDATLLRWGLDRPGDPRRHRFDQKLQGQCETFAPHWFVESSAMFDEAGFHDSWMRREKVFITQPIHEQIPCRFMTTVPIPAGQKTTLHLDVGHYASDPWRLVVNVDSTKQLDQQIGSPISDSNLPHWQSVEVDLTPFAGKKVFIEILNAKVAQHRSRAGWSRIELISTPVQP